MTLKTILCVDDEKDIRSIAQLVLQTLGQYQVALCDSGSKAVEAIAQHQPDLVLLDVMMPGLSGPQTLQAIHATYPEQRVAFMTAKTQADEIAELMAQGAIGVLTKPFDPMQLSAKVKTLWESSAKTLA